MQKRLMRISMVGYPIPAWHDLEVEVNRNPIKFKLLGITSDS